MTLRPYAHRLDERTQFYLREVARMNKQSINTTLRKLLDGYCERAKIATQLDDMFRHRNEQDDNDADTATD
jgi:hypothetical protein